VSTGRFRFGAAPSSLLSPEKNFFAAQARVGGSNSVCWCIWLIAARRRGSVFSWAYTSKSEEEPFNLPFNSSSMIRSCRSSK
jgi:hypothetical protein